MSFVHLHVHSEYSFLDGACRIKDLVARAAGMGMPALALTDDNGLYGAIEFYQIARQYKVKPILGCQINFPDDSHLILLAKNLKGYENLVQLVSHAHLHGAYHKPRFDKSLLAQYTGGLVALSGGLTGEIRCLLLAGKYRESVNKALEYKEILGPENFYLELQSHGLISEVRVNSLIKELAQEYGIPLVATNDVHYLDPQDASVHEIMTAVRTNTPIQKLNSLELSNPNYFLKSPAEMTRIFEDVPEAIENTLKIADLCSLELDLGRPSIPVFPLAEGYDPKSFFSALCKEGLRKRFKVNSEIRKRLQREIKIIVEMNLVPYFLIVADLVSFARDKGIPVGPGRGSAGGSLVAYCLGITDIDPIKHNLFFERFLNPERPDLPDIDLDLCGRRREEVLSYLYHKYAGQAAQIGIFNTFGARGAVRDVGKALDLPQKVTDLVAGNLPAFSGVGGIEHSIATLPEFKKIPVDKEPLQTLLEKSKTLEGRIRHTSIHAAGVIVGSKKFRKLVPLYRGPGGQIVSQYGPETLESLGLIKIDLLGLRNLTIIDDTLKLLAGTRGITLATKDIPLDDSCTYELLQKGDTLGCFQMESTGMRTLLRKLKPENLDDLIILLALYRPGPWDSGMVEKIIKRRSGKQQVTYPSPLLQPVLKGTYGLLLFQEQVMQVASIAAGFSLGEADLLRRAIAHNSPILQEYDTRFVRGCLKNGLSNGEARNIWHTLTQFGGFSFNKAHSTAYAYISYHTAFLKANYPGEYFASLMSSHTGYYSISVYAEEARRRGIKILPPDINRSNSGFTVEEGKIRVGLDTIKGIGLRSIMEILKSRSKRGNYSSLYDFCYRVDTRVVKQTAIKNLINTGAFDSLSSNRTQLLARLDCDMKTAQFALKGRKSGQLSLWSGNELQKENQISTTIPDYSDQEKQNLERELLSINLGEHPLYQLKSLLRKHRIKNTSEIASLRQGANVIVAGTVINSRRQPTRNNEYMVYILLEDQTGQVEVVLYPHSYQRYLYELNPRGILVQGKIVFEGEQHRIIAEKIQDLEVFLEKQMG